MNPDKLKEVYINFALEMLNKEVRDFVVYQAPPHIQELYTRLLTAFEAEQAAEEDIQINLDELQNPPTAYSWKSDNPYAGIDVIKADRWEQARMMLMKQRT